MSWTRVIFVYSGVGEILMRCDTAYGECVRACVRAERCGLTCGETLLVRSESSPCQDLAKVRMCSGTGEDSHAMSGLKKVPRT